MNKITHLNLLFLMFLMFTACGNHSRELNTELERVVEMGEETETFNGMGALMKTQGGGRIPLIDAKLEHHF